MKQTQLNNLLKLTKTLLKLHQDQVQTCTLLDNVHGMYLIKQVVKSALHGEMQIIGHLQHLQQDIQLIILQKQVLSYNLVKVAWAM
ncbi:hypothetical protein AZH47_09940 [Corynebacterium striatum]|nr:hypothetical protein AZH47_09940 [Corynebacterium striatum]